MSVEVAHEVLAGPTGAPAVVLSGSLGSTRAMWDRNVDLLREHFTVVRYDTRGHGDSPVVPGPCTVGDLADDVTALLDRLDLPRVHLVGLSLGGMTALRLAARDPARVDRLVVLCTSALLAPASAWTDRATLVRERGTAAVAEAVVQRWYSPGFLATERDRVTAAEKMVAGTPAEGYAACCEAIAAMDLTHDLPDVTAPLLAVAGADDPATPPPHLARIADSVRDGRLLVVPDAAHLANDEQPDTVTAAIVTHLRGEA